MISWPCLLKLDGDDELIYLPSKSDFISECADLILSKDDIAIDSQGHQYQLRPNGQTIDLASTNTIATLDEVVALIQAHEFSQAELCLTKIQFLNISDAIESLAFQR
ncbi:DUF4144 family protein [uncultured Vibrio sp.]|uniref:DUF4144 family protein n=1 Tax=uncultured Vibrio sp. TaxID=114054 RepID=UPI0025CDBC0B|nr:DUF4144 family protein [uncultured Vibrio sp.]